MSLITTPLRWACRGLCAACCIAGCVIGLMALLDFAF